MSIIQEALQKLQVQRTPEPARKPLPVEPAVSKQRPAVQKDSRRASPRRAWVAGALLILLSVAAAWTWLGTGRLFRKTADSPAPTVELESSSAQIPAPVVSEAVVPRAPSGLPVLSGILSGGEGKPLAVFGSRLVGVGERVVGYEVVSIGEETVVLARDGEDFTVKLQ